MALIYVKWKHIASLLVAVCSIFVFCEFIIYYVVQIQCTWPQVSHATRDEPRATKVMLLSDPHLLGEASGHWFDKLRREWQMWRAFQTAMMLHEPHAVFILGDVFDEGMRATERQFARYRHTFHNMFYHSNKTKLYAVVGNHDIGFHYLVIQDNQLHTRFESAFGESVRLIELNGNLFISINSMAMEGDGCTMCSEAMERLAEIEETLACSQANAWSSARCRTLPHIQYSKPILLSHFPLYRASDAECTGEDAAVGAEKFKKFKEQFHCLSQSASKHLISALRPRLIFSGHTHSACHRKHSEDAEEYTLPSFSWRNINNPSYMMLVVRNNNYAIAKCYMPKESTVICTYVIGICSIICWQLFKSYLQPHYEYQSKRNSE